MIKMGRPSAHPGFKALLTEWNQKLRESGFRDAETGQPEIRNLKKSGTERRYETLDSTSRGAKEEFFEQLAHHIRKTPLQNQLEFGFTKKLCFDQKPEGFDNETDFHILTLYSRGLRQTEIKARLHIRSHRCRVYYPIYYWKKKWGLSKE